MAQEYCRQRVLRGDSHSGNEPLHSSLTPGLRHGLRPTRRTIWRRDVGMTARLSADHFPERERLSAEHSLFGTKPSCRFFAMPPDALSSTTGGRGMPTQGSPPRLQTILVEYQRSSNESDPGGVVSPSAGAAVGVRRRGAQCPTKGKARTMPGLISDDDAIEGLGGCGPYQPLHLSRRERLSLSRHIAHLRKRRSDFP